MPQGAFLGPLIFLIYINDLTKVVNCNLKLFADDTCLYVMVDDPTCSATVLNNALNNVQQWASQCLANFNPGKTNQWCLQTRRSLTPNCKTAVEGMPQHKHLGLIFNTRLSSKYHVSEIIPYVLLDVMHKLSRGLDKRTLETIYETFIRLKLEYACIVWDDFSEQDSKAKENCQLRAARIVIRAKKGTSHENLYYETFTVVQIRRKKIRL